MILVLLHFDGFFLDNVAVYEPLYDFDEKVLFILVDYNIFFNSVFRSNWCYFVTGMLLLEKIRTTQILQCNKND